jgi:hypothetical protein
MSSATTKRASQPANSDRWIPGFQNSAAPAGYNTAPFHTSLGIQTRYLKIEELAVYGYYDCIRLDTGYTASMSSFLTGYGQFPFELNFLKRSGEKFSQ